MNDIIVSAGSVVKNYDGGSKGVIAVNGVSLEIKKGESLAIIGPSGAGKSTLLHILGGLDRPTSGNVSIDGDDIYSMADGARAKVRSRKVGFVFQFYHLLPEFTALENVMMPGFIRGRCTKYDIRSTKDRAESLLKSVGLGDRTHHKPGELSGGEQQRVAIARALINDPLVLLCDEPTGNLDSKNSESVYNLLLELKSRNGVSIVTVTHDEGISARSDRTIRLKDGKIYG